MAARDSGAYEQADEFLRAKSLALAAHLTSVEAVAAEINQLPEEVRQAVYKLSGFMPAGED